MNSQGKNSLELAILSVIFVFLCVIGILADFTSGLLASGVDGIMLLLICLMMGGIFTLQVFLAVQSAGWLKAIHWPQRKEKEKQAAAPAASPAEEK